MSFTMQPCGRDGRAINGGNHYANAHTVEDARKWAQKILAQDEYLGYVVRSVDITGAMFEFRGHAWERLSGREFREYNVDEVIWSERPYPYTEADLRMECYESTVMDYWEIVHETRSDGTCKCGDSTRGARR